MKHYFQQIYRTVCMITGIMICMLSNVLSSETETPCLNFQEPGNYSIHTVISKWTKVTMNMWQGHMDIFTVKKNHMEYNIHGFQIRNHTFILPVHANHHNGHRLPVYIESQSTPGDLHFRFQKHIYNISTLKPIKKDMFSMQGITPGLMAYVSDIATPHILLSFNQEIASLQTQKPSVYQYGFAFHQPKTYEIKGLIQSDEWKTDQKHPHICYAKLYAFMIDNVPYKGFRKTSGKYLLDVLDQQIQKHQGQGVTICVEHHSPGTLRYYSKWQATKRNRFKTFEKSDFTFVDHPYFSVDRIVFDYIPDTPSLLLKLTRRTTRIAPSYPPTTSSASIQKPSQPSKTPDFSRSTKTIKQNNTSYFDTKEYKKLCDIYEMNISNGFYCTLQDFTFDQLRKRFLEYSSWCNQYGRKLVPDTEDPLKNTFYIHVISEHTRNKHSKEYFIIKALDQQLSFIQANRNIDRFNKTKFADQTNWKIPTISELTHIFQFKKYHESISNLIKSFMPPFTYQDKITFWTSTFQNREKKILWQVTFRFNKEYCSKAFLKMDYDLTYHMIDPTDKAYLLPISVQ